MNPEVQKVVREFANRIQVSFRDQSLLEQALTHTSYANEQNDSPGDNQRLEYLGDSVLGLSINRYIYHLYPEYTEGQLARIKSLIVSENALARGAREIDLGNYLILGRGELSSGGRDRSSNLADALEAVIAAIYLDQGFDQADEFILRVLKNQIEAIEGPEKIRDPKSRLQEIIQKKSHTQPVYDLVSEFGPDHRRIFECRVVVDGREIGRGKGSSIKRAQQAAAESALAKGIHEKL